ncbi:hypothetical protein FQR65_LT05932 [Abscondita terminalis]|nr:hypothetical protein FQR65_LT05932 [Abscondita terminalis]
MDPCNDLHEVIDNNNIFTTGTSFSSVTNGQLYQRMPTKRIRRGKRINYVKVICDSPGENSSGSSKQSSSSVTDNGTENHHKSVQTGKPINVRTVVKGVTSGGNASGTQLGSITSEFQQLTLAENHGALKTKVKKKKQKNVKKAVLNNEKLSGNIISDIVDDSKQLCDFKITAVCSQFQGKVFRIKKIGCRHIHKTFCKDLDDGYSSTRNTNNELYPKIDYIPVTIQNGIVTNKTIPQLHSSNLQSSSSVLNACASNTVKSKKTGKKSKLYPIYWAEDEVNKGLANGQLVKGVLRINQKNHNEAYVSEQNRSLQDYFLPTVIDRNRALEGDLVAIKIKPKEKWTEKQKTASVVYIMEMVHPRTAVGHFLPLSPDKKKFATFIPRDKRVPRIKLPRNSCPEAVEKQNNTFDILYKAKITSWSDPDFAEGVITDLIGIAGDLDSELSAILSEYDISAKRFPSENLDDVQCTSEITEAECANRLDLRKECIFTIDPLTARDLDDAVSCKDLPNGNLEVGVHISDVAFYLNEGTNLDKVVRKKATSVYFVNNVFHMLPELLCQTCSLLPGVDKRSFSVIWEMKHNGDIISQRFSRTIMNSCTQLAYEHAQMMIDDPKRIFEQGELPEIFGGYDYNDLSRTVNTLNNIAVQMRKKRFDEGALRIDQTKLLFKLDQETGEPLEFFTYENKESHRMIEEFMLLANMSVARKIVDDFPSLAFLRCHDPPKETMLIELKKKLESFGFEIDTSSSKSLQSSIWGLQDKLGVPQMAALNHLLAKPMKRARYFCAATERETGDFSHYALNVPIYTHFTSPIRRYADVMVHRLLASSLGYSEPPKWTIREVTVIADNCNDQKYRAKQAGDKSSNVFLAHYIEKHQPFVKTAVVLQVRNHSFDVLVHATGSIVRVTEKSFDKGVWSFDEKENNIYLVFPETPEYGEAIVKVTIFETVTINLTRKPNTNDLEAQLLRPISSTVFENKRALH